jgi:prophage regulatory protein
MQRVRFTLQMIGKKALAERLCVSRWTLMRWVALGRFPPPIRASTRTLVWRVSVVDDWLRERGACASRRPNPTWLHEGKEEADA